MSACSDSNSDSVSEHNERMYRKFSLIAEKWDEFQSSLKEKDEDMAAAPRISFLQLARDLLLQTMERVFSKSDVTSDVSEKYDCPDDESWEIVKDNLERSFNSISLNLDDLTLVESLATGSFNEVYRHRRKTGEDFAVKVTPAINGQPWISSAKILKELALRNVEIWELEKLEQTKKICALLEHTNIVHIENSWTQTILGTPFSFTAMEFCEGGSLHDAMNRREFVEKAGCIASLKVIRGTLEGLAYLHLNGYVHRDIHPKHILLTKELVPKISGLKLVTHVAERMEMSVGTDLYMSPEVAGSRHYNEKADIYSLGIVVYEMLLSMHEKYHPKCRMGYVFEFTRDTSEVAVEIQDNCMKDLVEVMVAYDPNDRPSAAELLSSSHFSSLHH